MVEPRRLYERIARNLAKAIEDGVYEVGQRLPSERELAQSFEVSRPTVREAITRMTSDAAYAAPARAFSHAFLPKEKQGTKEVGALIELVYRIGWQHLFPVTANPWSPLPFYRDAIYGLPLDILALYAFAIAVVVLICKQLWAFVVTLWNGDKWQ